MKAKQLPSQARLKEVFDYDGQNLIWKERVANCVKVGAKIERTGTGGYVYVILKGSSYLAHRIIWKWVTGKDPVDMLDHIDGNVTNNCMSNLREADVVVNGKNRKLGSNNTTGAIGVIFRERCINRPYVATMKGKDLGYFKTFEEAVAARKQAEADHNYHENHGRV